VTSQANVFLYVAAPAELIESPVNSRHAVLAARATCLTRLLTIEFIALPFGFCGRFLRSR
jgi:hypothetical protein